ncbi:Probable guanine nucleotide exchange factor MCF2L2 [Eumeta japonica]|uniref:Probable guanine nucleotide exchange factor MCF2L2 n=1 Tax=Eumeta variegata TaxID=151549 RepID=A0A4C1W2B0_EUMVA|nr:Probable guanine nucleotide exchange factor MCF2L2 [Eumeta japonica]
MTEVGETASRVESLIREAVDFEKLCNCDLDTAQKVIDDGTAQNSAALNRPFHQKTSACVAAMLKWDALSWLLIKNCTKKVADAEACAQKNFEMKRPIVCEQCNAQVQRSPTLPSSPPRSYFTPLRRFTATEFREELMQDPLSSVDHIESKCEELRRTSDLLLEKINKRNMLLAKARELMDRIDKANEWCAIGVELLAGEGGLAAVERLLEEAREFGLKSPEEFKEMLMTSATQETRALVGQVVQRVEDVWLMVSLKRVSLQRAAAKPARPVQSVPPQSAAPPPTPQPQPALNCRSTTEAGVELIHQIFDTWEDSRDTIGVFCDLSKAFDCVYHDTLFRKLHHYGVTDRSLELLESYLSDRIQRVDFNVYRVSGHFLRQSKSSTLRDPRESRGGRLIGGQLANRSGPDEY